MRAAAEQLTRPAEPAAGRAAVASSARGAWEGPVEAASHALGLRASMSQWEESGTLWPRARLLAIRRRCWRARGAALWASLGLPAPSPGLHGARRYKSLTTLLGRDGPRCRFCRRLFGPELLPTRDHFHPQALGGRSRQSNLVLACRPCNARKGSDHPRRWRQRARA